MPSRSSILNSATDLCSADNYLLNSITLNPKSRWDLNGDLSNSASASNPFSSAGSAAYTTGLIAQCGDFNNNWYGYEDGWELWPMLNFSVSVWFKFNDGVTDGQSRGIFSAGYGCDISANNGTIQARIRPEGEAWTTIVSSSTYDDSNWHLAVMIVVSDAIYLYIDNILVDSDSISWNGTGYYSTGGRITTGVNRNDLTNTKWIGQIEQIRIFDYALDLKQRTQLYNEGFGTPGRIRVQPSLLWTPSRTSKDGIDLTGNNTPSAQNVSDLTLSNGPYPPIIGSPPVCEFGGTSGYIDLGDESALEFSTAFTAIVLQKLPDWSGANNNTGVVGKYFGTDEREWVIVQNTSLAGSPMFVSFGDPSDGRYKGNVGWNMSRFALDEWQVMAVTYDVGSVSMYLDGSTLGAADKNNNTIPTSLYNGSAPFRIGTFGNGNYLEGSIALVAVYGSALSAGQIQAASKLLLRGA